ncbi:hypothetical protein BKA56DRAFT_666032 [Ilyonectria sp. MPI-CAGE-AT-0026]|nr:hypothetical protein BKA56DRAFT_666032 [Ilyonectria sp. MPI-CAGE-AT-0026]
MESVFNPYKGPSAADGAYSGMSLDEFLASLRLDKLQDTLGRRQANLEWLFKDAATKVTDPYSASSDIVAMQLREIMKDSFNKLHTHVQDIRLSKEHLRIFSNKKYDGEEPVVKTLKNYLLRLVKEAETTDTKLVDAISEYELLDDMEERKKRVHFALPEYHESIFEDDAEHIHWPADAPPFDEPDGRMEPGTVHTRRVMMNNLPKGISAAQVAKGVRALGGLLGITMVTTPKMTGDGKDGALLEFKWASSAAHYVDYIRKYPMNYVDAEGVKHRAEVELVPTRSYPVSASQKPIGYSTSGELPNGRCLEFKHFPKGGVWYFFDRVGTMNVLEASYLGTTDPNEDGVLTVEFASVFYANYARDLVSMRKIEYYTPDRSEIVPSFGDSEYKTDGLWYENPRHLIAHMEVDHLALKWDVRPYNMIWPMATLLKHQYKIARKPVPSTSEPETALSLSLKMDTAFEEDDGAKVRWHNGYRYVVVGSTIRILLRNGTWIIATQEEIKPLMTITLQDPAWAQFWDAYFANNQAINYRRWDAYAAIAKHRRQQSADQGLQG